MAGLWHFLSCSPAVPIYIELPVSRSSVLKIKATSVLVHSPVTTDLPNAMSDDAEEQDASTLGTYVLKEDIQ